MEYVNASSEYDLFLYQRGTPFDIRITTATKKIRTGDSCYMCSDTPLSEKALGLLRLVRSDAEFFLTHLQGNVRVDKNLIRYTHLSNLDEGLYRGFVEIDINKAYWQTAYDIGAISRSTYEKGLSADKRHRLIALGALASGAWIGSFDGKEMITRQEDKKIDTSAIFFKIAELVGLAVGSVFDSLNQLQRGSALGYWVDAVFVKTEVKDRAIFLLEKHGFSVKEKEIGGICALKKGGYSVISMTEIIKREEAFTNIRIKPFFVGADVKKLADSYLEEMNEALSFLGY